MANCATLCNALHLWKKRTQNPPTARSWGFDPPSRHQDKLHKMNRLQRHKPLIPRGFSSCLKVNSVLVLFATYSFNYSADFFLF